MLRRIGSGIVIVLVIIASVIAAVVIWPRPLTAPTVATPLLSPSPSPTVAPSPTEAEETFTTLHTQEIAGVASVYQFSLQIPASWQAIAVPEIEAIALYDPTTAGENALEKSQLFIRHFSGNDFLTLTTVNIKNKKATTLAGRPAIRYQIEKKPDAPVFAYQPQWRNELHSVTDIRLSDSNPSVFYVIAERPNLDPALAEKILSSLHLEASPEALNEPVKGFRERVTKKPFGIYITPETSPIQPERFRGFHTGADAEFTNVTDDVPVYAIAKGKVVRAERISGYGGVVVIEHNLPEAALALYGHLDPGALPTVGHEVTAGETIGRLGAGGTPETDGERTHLHFALLKKNHIDVRGYVPRQEELTAWVDPLTVL